MGTQLAAPHLTVTTADELPIEIVVKTPSGCRSHKISNLDDPNIKNMFDAITEIKQSLAVGYQPSDAHRCLIEYTSSEGQKLFPCNGGEKAFEERLREYQQQGGQNLRMMVE